ncbi:MAG: zinc metalloprotease HtpX [Archaeoglobus sp.]|nr:MAG: zinc metalloprotease HtpX [Archaeoglobus sp.]
MGSPVKVADWGLKMRMYFTMFMIFLVTLAFLTLLWIYGVSTPVLVVFAGGMLFLQYYFSDKIALLASGARIVDKDEMPELHEIVEELARKAGIPKPKVAIVDSPIPNAFATGRSPSSSTVAVTTGLLRILSRDEVEAVLGHEISHVLHRDVAVITFASFISTLAWFVMRWAMFMGFWGDRDRDSIAPLTLLAISSLVWLISFLLVMALSRYREYAADMGSALLTRKPQSLISALLKISNSMDRTPVEERKKVEGLNAFFIIPAISGETIMSLFSTHPPIEERIKKLEEIAEKMAF